MAAQGVAAGHISQDIYTLTIFLAIITISVTSYTIKFDNQLYQRFSKYFHFFDLMTRGRHLQFPQTDEAEYDIVLLGFDRIGFNIFNALQKMKKSFIVVDFNPDVIKQLVKKKVPCLYGDIGDPEILERINFKESEYVISTIPHIEDNMLVLEEVRKVNKKCVVFVTANQVEEAMKLYKKGADYVILPHFLGGEHVSLLLQNLKGLKETIKYKYAHMEEIKKRKELGHEHPINFQF